MNESKIVELGEHLPQNINSITIDGVDYAISVPALAKKTGNSYYSLSKYSKNGLPRVATNIKGKYLYPVNVCLNWIQENVRKQKPTEVFIAGKQFVDRTKIAELLGASISAIEKWQRRDQGLPWIQFTPTQRMYPVDDCLAWYGEFQKTKSYLRSVANMNTRRASESICNGCDNAYAHKCCWFRDYTPVEGWTAKKVPFSGAAYTFTYNVTDCPNFRPDPPRNASLW